MLIREDNERPASNCAVNQKERKGLTVTQVLTSLWQLETEIRTESR